jgi:hypothetical protein
LNALGDIDQVFDQGHKVASPGSGTASPLNMPLFRVNITF